MLRFRVADRITAYVAARIEVLLAELIALKRATDAAGDEGLPAQARGVAFRLVENFGAMSRSQFGEELKQLSQDNARNSEISACASASTLCTCRRS